MKINRQQLLDAARRAAEQVDGPLNLADFTRITGIKEHHVYRLFPAGGWNKAKREAGLDPSHNARFSDEELLREFHRVTTTIGMLPTWHVFTDQAQISAVIVKRRFGSVRATLANYRAWLRINHPDSPFLELLRQKLGDEKPSFSGKSDTDQAYARPKWKKLNRPSFGPPINFRGLQYAPANEKGVIALFVLLMRDLDIVIDTMQSAFPDCGARRLVDRHKNLWQHVSIEFEFHSRSFRDHGHDPDRCDLIVCWEHNWPDCPLEVLELKTVIDDLPP